MTAGTNSLTLRSFSAVDAGVVLPLAAEQRAMWLHAQTQGDSRAYVLPIAFRLTGPVSLRALRQAFDHLVSTHEALRTGFRLSGEAPVQQIHEISRCPFVVTSATISKTEDLEALTRRWMREAMGEGFQLEHPPLIRVHILRHSRRQANVLVLVHHLVFDGWSGSLLLSEVSRVYKAILDKGAPVTPATTCRSFAARESAQTAS